MNSKTPFLLFPLTAFMMPVVFGAAVEAAEDIASEQERLIGSWEIKTQTPSHKDMMTSAAGVMADLQALKGDARKKMVDDALKEQPTVQLRFDDKKIHFYVEKNGALKLDDSFGYKMDKKGKITVTGLAVGLFDSIPKEILEFVPREYVYTFSFGDRLELKSNPIKPLGNKPVVYKLVRAPLSFAREQERVWTSAVGTTLTAKLFSVKGQTVVLKTADGKSKSLAVTKLSKKDQEYIRAATAKAKAGGK